MTTTQRSPNYASWQDSDAEEKGLISPVQDGHQVLTDDVHTTIRHGFIRKVYGILSVQLLITTVMAACLCTDAAKLFIAKNAAILWVAMAVQLVLTFVMMCFSGLMRQFPTNYILLGVWTAVEGLLVGSICAFTDPQLVLVAAALTTGIVLSLTLFAFQTKYDFTSWAPYLFVVALGFFLTGLMMGIMGMFGVHIKLLHILYCGFGVILFSIYLVFDTQMIVGAKHARFEFSVDDYCFAALMLYIDIIQIFLYLLRLLQMLRSSD
uniref:Transmembrane BAX inhibitor motif-containing protein 4 n=1 Tax=Vitrella brassicaformis TaxID=1169539 RepID=A0A7S1JUQ6_9ALVE|mmetsp:Transcript_25799/g.64038  ORF Transcript_25799/g.64038 Transcript_25799/m.64038 type:complete len:265 (+) Transcript_25799:179-973(+)